MPHRNCLSLLCDTMCRSSTLLLWPPNGHRSHWNLKDLLCRATWFLRAEWQEKALSQMEHFHGFESECWTRCTFKAVVELNDLLQMVHGTLVEECVVWWAFNFASVVNPQVQEGAVHLKSRGSEVCLFFTWNRSSFSNRKPVTVKILGQNTIFTRISR